MSLSQAQEFHEKDPYALLRVDKTEGPEVVKARYRNLAEIFHPDHALSITGRDEAFVEDVNINFDMIHRAYQVLRDEHKREIYDRKGLAGVEAIDALAQSVGDEWEFHAAALSQSEVIRQAEENAIVHDTVQSFNTKTFGSTAAANIELAVPSLSCSLRQVSSSIEYPLAPLGIFISTLSLIRPNQTTWLPVLNLVLASRLDKLTNLTSGVFVHPIAPLALSMQINRVLPYLVTASAGLSLSKGGSGVGLGLKKDLGAYSSLTFGSSLGNFLGIAGDIPTHACEVSFELGKETQLAHPDLLSTKYSNVYTATLHAGRQIGISLEVSHKHTIGPFRPYFLAEAMLDDQCIEIGADIPLDAIQSSMGLGISMAFYSGTSLSISLKTMGSRFSMPIIFASDLDWITYLSAIAVPSAFFVLDWMVFRNQRREKRVMSKLSEKGRELYLQLKRTLKVQKRMKKASGLVKALEEEIGGLVILKAAYGRVIEESDENELSDVFPSVIDVTIPLQMLVFESKVYEVRPRSDIPGFIDPRCLQGQDNDSRTELFVRYKIGHNIYEGIIPNGEDISLPNSRHRCIYEFKRRFEK